jgi:hypothetical protein
LDGWFTPAMSAIAESEVLLKQVRKIQNPKSKFQNTNLLYEDSLTSISHWNKNDTKMSGLLYTIVIHVIQMNCA